MPDTTASPFRTIVRIIDEIGNNYYQASGVLISPDEVLTASHVVWSSGIGTATNITVTPGYDSGTRPFGSVSGTMTHYNAINDSNGRLSLWDIPNDYALIHLSSPVSVGYMSLGADFAGGITFVAGYPSSAAGAQVGIAETMTTGSFNLLDGPSIGPGSSGGPVFTTDASGAGTVVGLVSAGDTSGAGYFPKITSAVRAQLLSWVAQDDGTPPVAGYIDGVTGQQGAAAMSTAIGGPSYLEWKYIWSSSDSVSLSTSVPNSFLHGGSGNDAIAVTSGNNVLDGGSGSNFLVGGTGTDTFFTDARNPVVVWNTVINFHAGDTVTLWGFTAGVSSYTWDALPAGAVGATGATLRANIVGGSGRTGNGIDASITFAGLSVAQARSLIALPSQPSSNPYLLIYDQGV